jgi:hypothetical protein
MVRARRARTRMRSPAACKTGPGEGCPTKGAAGGGAMTFDGAAFSSRGRGEATRKDDVR